MIAEFKHGEMALRPSAKRTWNSGAAPEIGAETESHASEGSMPVPGRRGLAWKAKSQVRAYAISMLLVAAALIFTILMRGVFAYPFLYLFFVAVMASAWIGGAGPGFFAAVLSTLVVAYYVVPPFNTFWMSAADTTYFAAFRSLRAGGELGQFSEKGDRRSADRGARPAGIPRGGTDGGTAEIQRGAAKEHRGAPQGAGGADEDAGRPGAPVASVHDGRVNDVNRARGKPAADGGGDKRSRLRRMALRESAPDWRRLADRRSGSFRTARARAKCWAIFVHSSGKKLPRGDWLDMNDVIQELTVFLRGEALNRRLALHTDLAVRSAARAGRPRAIAAGGAESDH